MNRSGWIVAVLASKSLAFAAPDLTPTEAQTSVEGFPIKFLKLSDGNNSIEYSPPERWKVNGGRGHLQLSPSSSAQVQVEIDAQTLAQPMSSTDLSAFEALALQTVPRDAKNVEKLGTTPGVVKISGKSTVEVNFNYVQMGQTVRVVCLYLPRGRDLFRFRVVANTKDFASIKAAFFSSLYSIQGV